MHFQKNNFQDMLTQNSIIFHKLFLCLRTSPFLKSAVDAMRFLYGLIYQLNNKFSITSHFNMKNHYIEKDDSYVSQEK